MEEIKRRFIDSVAAQLSAAPQSDTKDELIEELSDNLYRRFLDMTSAGMEEEAAFRRSLDDLGDVDELLSYLGVEPRGDVTIDQKEGQTRITTKEGQTITINGGDDEPIVINVNGGEAQPEAAREEYEAAQEEADDAQEEADDAQEEADEAQEEADAAQERADDALGTDEEDDAQKEADAAQAEADAAQGRADAAQARADAAQARADAARARADAAKKQAEQRDRQQKYGQFPQSDLDAILAGVSEACNTAIDQAKAALKQARDAMKRRTTVQRENGHVKVHFNTHPDGPAPTPPAPPAPPEQAEPAEPIEPPAPPTPPAGWEFEAELDTDAGRFFAGAGPKEQKDVVYGFGYDKDRGGFYAQWGEYPGGDQDVRGPHFTGEDSYMEHQDDGSYSVTALKDLRGIEVFTTSGDVAIHVSEAPEAGVIIDGDVDELDVTCSADGVLTIREGRTASSSFFSRRGFCSADVELYLPRRHWELLTINTASGDVDIDRDGLSIDQLSVSTMSGDLNARLRACTQLYFKSASGDIDLNLEGRCTELRAETMSGDINLRGQVENAFLKTASGDIELEGLTSQFRGATISGDVQLEVSQLPQTMELSSKSGDVEARIPDEGPFTLHMKTVSGEISCGFPMNYTDGAYVYGDGSGPVYSMRTVSGDVSLERR